MRRIDPQAAAEEMRAAGVEPLEPYPGIERPWRCKCASCGSINTPRLKSIRSGNGACRSCAWKQAGRTQRVSDEDAIAELATHNATPLEPYPQNVREPWRAKCDTCGSIIKPRIADLRAGQGACKKCASQRAGKRLRNDPNKAARVMLDAGIEPLEPYPGGKTPWRCRCTRCGNTILARYETVRKSGGGCSYCARNRKRSEDEAVELMRRVGKATPLEPYKSGTHKWHCKCDECGRDIYPRLNSTVLWNRKACKFCADYGYSYTEPAILYVLNHPEYSVYKIGIAGTRSKRMRHHREAGFDTISVYEFADGNQAYEAEDDVFDRLTTLGIQVGVLPRGTLGRGGHTETIWQDAISEADLLRIVRRSVTRHRVIPAKKTRGARVGWLDMLQLLTNYQLEHQEIPPIGFETRDGIKLGRWIASQLGAYHRGTLSREKTRLLASVPGWLWIAAPTGEERAWESAYIRCAQHAETGQATVPLTYKTLDGFGLGRWQGEQRKHHRQGRLSPERAERLERLPGWDWTPKPGPSSVEAKASWLASYDALVEYQAKHKTLPTTDSDARHLAAWAKKQRSAYHRDRLSRHKASLLERVAGWEWGRPRPKRAHGWDAAYARMLAYVAENGSAVIPSAYQAPDGFKLGRWAVVQREQRRAGTLGAKREALISAMPGWEWDPPRGNSRQRSTR